MNQATYDTMTASRNAGAMSSIDQQDYDALNAAGAFKPFQAPPESTTYVSPPPTPPPPMTGTLDVPVRPQVEPPQGAPPGQPYTGGTVPRGLSYENTQRDFATSLGDRMGLPQLHPADIGVLGQGMDLTHPFSTDNQGELGTRMLYRDPNAPVRGLPGAVGGAVMSPSALVGAAVESQFGRPAGDQAQYLTNLLLPTLLLGRRYPKAAGAIGGLGVLGDYISSHVMRALGR